MTKLTPVHVEHYYSGDWHDMTAPREIYERDPITIQAGRDAETSRVNATVVNVSIKNRTDPPAAPVYKYSPRNPLSPLYGLIGRNDPIRVWVQMFIDGFDDRTVASGWGTAPDGRTWTAAGSGTGTSSVGSGVANHQQSTAAGYRINYLTPGDSNLFRDCEVRTRLFVNASDQDVTGAPIEPANLVLRMQDLSNYYFLRLEINTDQTVDLSIRALVANNELILSGSPVLVPLIYSGQTLMISFQAEGEFLAAKVWDPADGEPFGWQVKAVDRRFTAGTIGIRSGAAAGNTNIPVAVQYGSVELRIPRACAEVESWPQRWQRVQGTPDVWAPVKATGIMRRLGAAGSNSAARSSLRRAYEHDPVVPKALWPLDSGQLSDAAPMVIGAGTGLTPTATVAQTSLGTDELAPWLGPGLSMSDVGSTFVGRIDNLATAPTTITLDATFRWVKGSGVIHAHWLVYQGPTPAESWEIAIDKAAGGGSVTLTVLGNTGGGALEVNSVTTTTALNSPDPHYLRLQLVQSGGNVNWSVYCDDPNTPIASGTAAGFTLKPYPLFELSSSLSSGSTFIFGPVAYFDSGSPTFQVTPMRGYTTEPSWRRIERLCGEEGIAFSASFLSGTRLGPQGLKPPLELMFEAAEADGGTLFELRGFLALAYRNTDVIYNSPAEVALDYALAEAELDPTEDTDHVENDVTVTRINGGSARSVQTTGPLNVNEPSADPNGVGRYPVDVSLNLSTDAVLAAYAAWRRHVGTWDEPRYKSITINFTRLAVDGKVGLMIRAASLGVGDRFTVANPPVWQGPDTVDQRAQGFTETLGNTLWTLELNTTAAGPYRVVVWGNGTIVDDDTTRWVGYQSTISASFDAGTLPGSMSVATASGRLWTTNPAHFPLKVTVAGVVLTVSAISGTSSPQTFTVTAANAPKVIPAGSAVVVYRPTVYARL